MFDQSIYICTRLHLFKNETLFFFIKLCNKCICEVLYKDIYELHLI
jgi:hypothetical protein